MDDNRLTAITAKDERIDELIGQAEKLISDLNATVSDMKRILEAAVLSTSEAREKQATEKGAGS